MKHTFFTTVLCMVMLTGCQQAEEITNPSEELPMAIEASIENHMASRYASGNNNGTPNSLVFSSGDNIGVFVNDRVADKWTKGNDENWTSTPSTIYWPDKVSNHDFYAFYPHQEALSKTSVPMPSLAGQTGTMESLSKCDFMVATTKQSYGTNGIVSFSGTNNCFKHVSSLVAITILKESDLKESIITKISFEGANTGLGSTTEYSFGTDTEPATIVTKSSIDIVESSENFSISMKETEKDLPLYFILNSGADLANITFSIEYNTGEKHFTASKSGLGSGSLTSGNRYNFNLNITDGVLSISGCEIEGWGTGSNMNDIIINTPTEQ